MLEQEDAFSRAVTERWARAGTTLPVRAGSDLAVGATLSSATTTICSTGGVSAAIL